MAQHLLQEAFHIPAASLGGAVLEDGLRRLATVNNVTVKTRDDAGSLNRRLRDAGGYDNMEYKRLQTAIDLRKCRRSWRVRESQSRLGAQSARDH